MDALKSFRLASIACIRLSINKLPTGVGYAFFKTSEELTSLQLIILNLEGSLNITVVNQFLEYHLKHHS